MLGTIWRARQDGGSRLSVCVVSRLGGSWRVLSAGLVAGGGRTVSMRGLRGGGGCEGVYVK